MRCIEDHTLRKNVEEILPYLPNDYTDLEKFGAGYVLSNVPSYCVFHENRLHEGHTALMKVNEFLYPYCPHLSSNLRAIRYQKSAENAVDHL
jgi:hypothetical protein